MATLLRPPLVSQPQPKRPIAPVDYFSRPLTLGINPNAAVRQLYDSAPPRKLQVRIDPYPNLLENTLAPTGVTIPLPLSAGRIDWAAPRKRWIGDPEASQGFIIDNGPEAKVAQLSDSAPPRKKQVQCEQYLNLLTTTLAVQTPYALPLSAEQTFDDSAPPRKRQVFDLGLYRPLTLGINPNAAVAQLSDSATPRKAQVQSLDVPNLLTTTLAAAPAVLALPLNAIRVDGSAPPRKAQVQSFDFPNLSGTTLAPAQLALPRLAVRWVESAPPRKSPVYFEIPQNALVRQPVPKVQALSDGAPLPGRKKAWVSEPANRLTLTVTFVAVPDVVGDSQVDGTTTLQSAGFAVSVETAYSDTVPAGYIISESPAAGTLLASGSTVTITVSLGALLEVNATVLRLSEDQTLLQLSTDDTPLRIAADSTRVKLH